MNRRLKRLASAYAGKPVVITGGNGLFGQALAKQIKAFGGIPVSIDKSHTQNDAPHFACDICDEAALSDALDQIRSQFGPIRFAIANAAIDLTSEAHNLTPSDWRSIIETNLIGTTNLIALAYPHMQQAGTGDILIVSSGSAIVSFPFGLPYTSSKAGQVALALGLRSEASRYGVNVSCVPLPSLANDKSEFQGVRAQSRGGVDRDAYLKALPGKLIDADAAAVAALKGLDRRKAKILFPRSLSLTDRVVGLFPGLGAAIRSDIAKRFDKSQSHV